MTSPADQAQTGHRGGRGSGRSPLLPAASAGAPSAGQKKGGKKAGQPASNPQPRSQNLQETRKKGKMKLNKSTDEDIVSQLQRLDLRRADAIAMGTALVYDERLTDFHCLWDKNYPECPARLTVVKEKLAQYGLTQRCIPVQAREAVDEEILLVHSSEYLEQMKSTQSMSEEELRAMSENYDSVYLHPRSYSSACLAGGSVLQLVDKVFAGEVRNGMALVRPPGHHAHWEKMNGYCMFNNVAMAARYAQQEHGASRILIVDWDIHHGQGTQYMFEDDPSILYFSIHRYEQGHFWPHLPESDSHAVGKGRGEGFTINVPWNKIGMSDADYITAFLQLLLPVAHEFQPHLVLVAAGFDSVIGDPKGEMAASPACFAHLTHLLMPLAGGKLVLALEGGYNLRSLAEGSCAALKILLGDPCPRLASPVVPCQSALASISETICSHYKYWKSLRHYGDVDETQTEVVEEQEVVGITAEELEAVLDTTMAEVMRALPPERTGLVYDERMMEHFNAWDSHHPELPQRISRVYQRHVELLLVERCSRLPARHATDDELQMCHSSDYIQTIRSTVDMKPRDLHRLGCEYNSIFINPKSYDCARLATGCTFSAVEAVMAGKVQNAVAIVRPPGHHAERGSACGFCFFNTAALAARYAQRIAGRLLKVMILDWDVHHGNGTQHIFEDDPSVLYVSLHRYDHATFFPTSTDADYDKVGHGSGAGFNVNIPWNNSKMGDAEYLMAFHRAVIPIAYEFNPDLVVVSAGFDAARGDPLGGCLVSPEGYAHMTHLLMGLAGGKIVVVLEGGYNLSSISESMTMCTRTLLGDPLPDLGKLRSPQRSAQQSVSSTIRAHRKYWKSLQLTVPEFVVTEEAAVDQPVSPSKSHGHTPKPSTPKGKSCSSPGQRTTPVGTGRGEDVKQAVKPRVPMSPLGKPETLVGTENYLGAKQAEKLSVPMSPSVKPGTPKVVEKDHKVNKAGESKISVSTSGMPEIIVRFETDHEVEKAVGQRDNMSPLGKPETPMVVECDHDTKQAEKPRVPMSPSAKPESSMVAENDHEVDQAEESRVSVFPPGKPESTVRLEKDCELEKAVEPRVPVSPPGKPETPMGIEKKCTVGKAGESMPASPLGGPETTVRMEKDHELENEVLRGPISPLGKPDMPEETRADPVKDPSIPPLFPEEITHVGAEKDTFEPCPVEMGVPQLILKRLEALVGADSEEVLAGEVEQYQSPVKSVDHEQVSVTDTQVCQSVVKQPVTPKESEKAGSLAAKDGSSSSLPSEDAFSVLEATKDPGKKLTADQIVSRLPVGDPTTPLGTRKDPDVALTADMKALRLSAGEPVPMEQIFDLEQLHLCDGRGDSLASNEDPTVDMSLHQSPAEPALLLSAYQSPTSVPVGGARRKVKACVVFSDSPTLAGSVSPTLAPSSSPASASATSPAASLSNSPGQTAPTMLVSDSPAALAPSSPTLASSASPAALPPSSPVPGSQGPALSEPLVDAETMVGHKGGHSSDPVLEMSLQAVDTKGNSQKGSPEGSASTSPKKGELLEEATGWTNPLTTRTHCQIFGNYPEEESGMLYAVTPLPWCPHLDSVQPVPASGLNVEDLCRDCGGAIENWVCLVCYEVYCGRYINEHMLMHGLSSGHMVVLSYADLSVWCYSCESYIHNEALSDAKNAAHRMKFGDDVA